MKTSNKVMRTVKVVLEAGPIHIGMYKKNNLIIGHGEYAEVTVEAESSTHAYAFAMRAGLSPKGRHFRIFENGVELDYRSGF